VAHYIYATYNFSDRGLDIVNEFVQKPACYTKAKIYSDLQSL